jgi:hypothetical protein
MHSNQQCMALHARRMQSVPQCTDPPWACGFAVSRKFIARLPPPRSEQCGVRGGQGHRAGSESAATTREPSHPVPTGMAGSAAGRRGAPPGARAQHTNRAAGGSRGAMAVARLPAAAGEHSKAFVRSHDTQKRSASAPQLKPSAKCSQQTHTARGAGTPRKEPPRTPGVRCYTTGTGHVKNAP